MEIQTVSVKGTDHYALKFNGEIRTVLPYPLRYRENDGSSVTLSDGKYTICLLDEIVGYNDGSTASVEGYQFQLLVGDLCTSSYTSRE